MGVVFLVAAKGDDGEAKVKQAATPAKAAAAPTEPKKPAATSEA
jgi:hypothetical protein